MKFVVKEGSLTEIAAEALIVPHFQEEKEFSAGLTLLDERLNGLIREVVDSGDFKAEPNQVAVLYTRKAIPADRIVLAGLGKRKDLNEEKIRCAFSKAAQHIRGLGIKQLATAVTFNSDTISREMIMEAIVEGIYLGLYQFTPFKTLERDKIKELNEVVIVEEQKQAIEEIKTAVKNAEKISYAVWYVRDLVSTPSNEMTPTDMAREAESVALERKKVHVRVIDVKEMKELGMNAFLAVAGGSCQPPKFIILEYRGGRKNESPIVLVGKGLTFDSGGISIKPAEKMDEMKTDMAGGAVVMGTIMAACDLNLPLNVIGLVPAAENLPGGGAFKPGDVLKTLSGQTVEVISTDAEGRLILVDALTYALNYKPAAIIDIATLTGACVVALGNDVMGLLGTDDTLLERVKRAADITHERVWELPLWEEYHELIKSDVADFKNTAGRAAGTITAAALLSKFVADRPWVHLDIAGPVRTAKDKPYIPKGASGVGLRLFVQLLRDWKKSPEKP